MGDREKLLDCEHDGIPKNRIKNGKTCKVSCFLATTFTLFWAVLFFAVVIPHFYRLPTALTMEDEKKNVFIAERAYKDLYTLSNIGNKLTGSTENEVVAFNFVLNEVEVIKKNLLEEVFDMEIDVSRVSGAFTYKHFVNTYQAVQNIAVKLTPKNCTSKNYLLINSHFDSKPFTNSAGDSGFMIAVMLEVLRVITTTNQSFHHPLVFLFNGAEEGTMQASHGFITQHKWAPYCKAVVNLDAGGSGGREALIQSGPSHPWLLSYYKKYIKYPFATVVAEEIFETGLIPSDSDFSQFKKYGNVPGLDMIQLQNGYIYHTKYDTIDVIPRESFQNSGDNVLSLVRGLSNASELHDTQKHKGESSVFFDFLGLHFIHYSKSTAISLNLFSAATCLFLVTLSIWRMAAVSHTSFCKVFGWFTLVLIIQLTSFVLGVAVPLIVANMLDSVGLPLTHYSSPMLLIGLYVFPSLIALSLPTTIYFTFQRNPIIPHSYHLQLAAHGQAVILALIVAGLTGIGLRSTYVVMIPLVSYVLYLAFTLLTMLHDRGYAWTGFLKVSQIVPFLHTTYIIYVLTVILIPIAARSGSAFNTDLYIAALVAIGTVLSFGFLVPLINTFRKPGYVIFSLLAITAVSLFLATSTQVGFPYRPKTNGQRIAFLVTILGAPFATIFFSILYEFQQVRNKFYEYDGKLSKDESGYLFSFQDRREESTFRDAKANLTGLPRIKSKCEKQMMCGMPLFDYRYVGNCLQSKWIPRTEPIETPESAGLELLKRTLVNRTTLRLEFNLTGPSHMSLFFQAYEGAEITEWSFLRYYLDNPPDHPLTYHIYLTYGVDSSPLNFFVDISKENGDFDVPLFQLGVSRHYIQTPGDAETQKFISTFPSYGIVATWPVFYQRFIF